jgi:hypothetical protein
VVEVTVELPMTYLAVAWAMGWLGGGLWYGWCSALVCGGHCGGKSVHWDWARDIGTGTHNGGSGVARRSPLTNPTVLGPDCMLRVIDSHSFVHFSALTTS